MYSYYIDIPTIHPEFSSGQQQTIKWKQIFVNSLRIKNMYQSIVDKNNSLIENLIDSEEIIRLQEELYDGLKGTAN